MPRPTSFTIATRFSIIGSLSISFSTNLASKLGNTGSSSKFSHIHAWITSEMLISFCIVVHRWDVLELEIPFIVVFVLHPPVRVFTDIGFVCYSSRS